MLKSLQKEEVRRILRKEIRKESRRERKYGKNGAEEEDLNKDNRRIEE